MDGLYPRKGALQLDLKKGEAILPLLGPSHPIILAPNGRTSRFKGVLRVGHPTLVYPHRATKAQIKEALGSLEPWFAKVIERVQAERAIIPATSVLFLGREVPIVKAALRCNDAKLTEKGLLVNAMSKDGAQSLAFSWLYRQAEAHLGAAVAKWGPKIGYQEIPFKVVETSTRWGSCVAGSRLSFSWRQIMAPPEVIDYLAVHEISHMKHQDHSDRYWNLVNETYPDWERWDGWLTKNGSILMNLYPKITLACLRQIKPMPAVSVSQLEGFRLVFGSEDKS